MNVSLDKLKNFLEVANKVGYANAKARKAVSLRPASEDYHFEQDGLVYHDTYFGARDFIGEEIVYQENKPIWGMNYYGYIPDQKISEKTVYDFLRSALMQDSGDILPVRGPREYSEGESQYANQATGTLDRFSGEEHIIFNNELVYHCWYHGGAIE